MEITITVLTPLYNRKKFLGAIFASLQAQSTHSFQWLVIDDGSEERSDDLVAEFKEKADFSIDYYYKKNGGKHSALNFSHPYIKGEFVLILDSDDTLTPDAVETCCEYWGKYRENKQLAVISFLKGRDETTSFAHYPKECISNHIDFRVNRGIGGDCCEVIRADVLREFPFPEIDGESFMDEIHLWYNVGKKYLTLYVNKIIYIADYLEDGLTKGGNALRRRNPKGGFYNQTVALGCKLNMKNKIKRAILLGYYGKLSGRSLREICREGGHPVLAILCYPAACLLEIIRRDK